MTDTAELELMSPREAYELASQWGSYMRDGDPGAVFYSFSASDATPNGPEHRAQLLTYTESLLALPDLDADDRADLEKLKLFFERYPDSGDEFRDTYRADSAKLLATFDDFTRAYITAALWTGIEPPDGHEFKDSDKIYDLPAEDIHPDALKAMAEDCGAFQRSAGHLLAQAYLRDGYSHGDTGPEGMAGHDFWLTRNGHGAGFWDRTPLDKGGLGDALSKVAKGFGESDLYWGDDGGIYL
jgi:hypothetical protein